MKNFEFSIRADYTTFILTAVLFILKYYNFVNYNWIIVFIPIIVFCVSLIFLHILFYFIKNFLKIKEK